MLVYVYGHRDDVNSDVRSDRDKFINYTTNSPLSEVSKYSDREYIIIHSLFDVLVGL